MYLGEIARNVILSLIDAAPKPVLFGGRSSALLNKQWGLDSAVLSEIEEAWEGLGRFSAPEQGSPEAQKEEKLRRIQGVLAQRLEMSPPDISLADADIVRKVCNTIATRAARMSGTAVAAILVHTGRARLWDQGEQSSAGLKDEGKRIGVGVDGR
jgi:hexokinase